MHKKSKRQHTEIIVMMGVSGSGKTTLGRLLARHLGWPFFDGDDFHPPENVARMAAGLPLTDQERAPWLLRLNRLLGELQREGQPAVLACSALKAAYRQVLGKGIQPLTYIHLQASFDTLQNRMEQREGHYMKASMLKSQIQDHELPGPEEAILIQAGPLVRDVLVEIVQKLGKPPP